MKQLLATKSSTVLALGLTIALLAWLASGQFGDAPANAPAATQTQNDLLTRVRVRRFHAQPISREIIVTGRTEPAREVTIRAEIEARVVTVEAQRGSPIKRGDVIARLDLRDRRAQLREAQAQVKQRELQYRAAQRLFSAKHQSQTQVAEARANLESARALLEHIEMEIDNATLYAPFAGILEERPVEVGDYLSIGDPVARILEQDPLVVSGEIAQQDIQRVRIGTRSTARLVTGQQVEGRIRYVATQANKATRTFRVELEVANPEGNLVAGVTSEIHIALEELTAHYLPMGVLALDDNGRIGVKTVNAENQVEFHAAPILRTTAGGVWLGELPQSVRVITVGQGFVTRGQAVEPVTEKAVAETKADFDRDPS